MEIQSLSIVVPTKECVCKCKTCVSRIHGHEEHYQNTIENTIDQQTWHFKEEYRRRLEFARDNGCNTMVLTGAPGEPLQNIEFLKKLAAWNQTLRKPFYWMELQTTGVLLNDLNFEQLRLMGVSTISLSNFNIFDDKLNFDVMGIPEILHYDLKAKCHHIKSLGFNLRICLNMMKWYDLIALTQIFDRLVELKADQVTFRKLYTSEIESPINDYISDMAMNGESLQHLTDLIEHYGKPLEILPFGSQKFSYRGISTVVDQDCMATNSNKVVRYLILRENCKLYSRWDDRGSLIF